MQRIRHPRTAHLALAITRWRSEDPLNNGSKRVFSAISRSALMRSTAGLDRGCVGAADEA
jgi:hypothetical protein